MVKKPEVIVVIGSECTGKTTLAKQLAEHFQVPFLDEYSRRYAEKSGRDLEYKDVLPIAIGQLNAEKQFLAAGHSPKIMDTCLLSTIIYSRMYYSRKPHQLEKMFSREVYDHFLLCYPDPQWADDGIRKMPLSRMDMHQMFEYELINRNLPYTLIRGPESKRLEDVIRIINQSRELF